MRATESGDDVTAEVTTGANRPLIVLSHACRALRGVSQWRTPACGHRQGVPARTAIAMKAITTPVILSAEDSGHRGAIPVLYCRLRRRALPREFAWRRASLPTTGEIKARSFNRRIGNIKHASTDAGNDARRPGLSSGRAGRPADCIGDDVNAGMYVGGEIS